MSNAKFHLWAKSLLDRGIVLYSDFKAKKQDSKKKKACGPGKGVDANIQLFPKTRLWRKVVFLGAFPVLGLIAAFVYTGIKNKPEKERPPFIRYTYLRRRIKRFPWGDGTRSFFHNPHVNPLPDGYEDAQQVEPVEEKKGQRKKKK